MSSAITTRGIKKSSSAVCKCEKTGNFEIRINKIPLEKCLDPLMCAKLNEVLEIIKKENLLGLDFDITLSKNGGFTGRVYAARQALCRAVLAYLANNFDEYKKQEIEKDLLKFDRFTLVTDTRVKEPKKYNGPGARARYQKSYR